MYEIKKIKTDVHPTTAYLLLGEGCVMNCSFCPQSRTSSGGASRLGRVTWPSFTREDLKEGLKEAEGNNIKRVCLQGVRQGDKQESLLRTIKEIKNNSSLPLCISAWIKKPQEAEELFAAGADRLSIALDVVNPDAYKDIKGGSYKERLQLLLNCARRWPGKISTHIIIGVGETEEETVAIFDKLIKENVTIALFAFTPIKGTPLGSSAPPKIERYRRMQAALYLLKNKVIDYAAMNFKKGVLTGYGVPISDLREYLKGGSAFLTSGCPDCNRPFYNESPGSVLYNYPRPLTLEEEEAAVDCVLAGLEEGGNEVAGNLAFNS